MNLLLFIVTLMISFIAVRIGAIAFELTGLEWSFAKFQSISCFTGTGFTTKESELVVGNPQRRRIASVLMVLGNVGLVTLIATFANTLRPNMIVSTFTIPFLPISIPSRILPWANLLILVILAYVIYRLFTRTKFTKRLTDKLRSIILKKEIVKPVSFEELIVATGGYGISQIEVCKESPILNKMIREANLRSHDITILAVERKGAVIPNPSADTNILLNDKLVCFGKLEHIRKEICVIHD
ncbi:hypothetical protein HQ550_04745 [bacterium]|nr:hypothetical protein [bacterium]